MKKAYSTSEAAKELGVSFRTIKNWIYENKIETFITPTKQHRITQETINKIKHQTEKDKTATYSRVSSTKQKEDLERQKQRLKEYATTNNHNLIKEYSEIASGLNDNRQKLNQLLQAIADKEINHLIIENTDRLTRFGYKYLEQYCKSHNTKITITNIKEIKEDYIKDLIDIIACFCARLYGKRSNKTKTTTKTQELLEQLKITETEEQEEQEITEEETVNL